jgi:SAM-dependent methyltransferase
MSTLWAERLFSPNGLTTEHVLGSAKALDVGCGQRKLPGATGLDILADSRADIVHNLNIFPWPVKTSEFDLVLMSHVLEHVDDVVATLDEIHRILKPGGSLVIQVPYFRSVDAFTDPTHQHFFTARSLDYACPATKLGTFKYTHALFEKAGFWYDWPGRAGGLGAAIRHFFQRWPWFYDQYFSVLLPARNLTWELRSITNEAEN